MAGTLSDRRVIGRRIEELDTPSLLLDAAKCEQNLRTMAAFFADKPCKLRPHFKNHKCVTLARRQLEAGSAVGITCAKLGEAEILADAGLDDLLIANQVLGAPKVARLVEAAKKSRLTIAIDHIDQARQLSEACRNAGPTIGVLVEIDGGMGRCGVEPGEPALELARAVQELPGIRFEGIQCFEGHTVYFDDQEKRSRAARASMQTAIDTRKLIEQSGVEVGVISGGSSSTYQMVGTLDGVDEVQAGTYATMDWRYHQLVPEFEIALSILACVISVRPNLAILDVGVKGAGSEFGPPVIKGHPDAQVPSFLSEEHCRVQNPPNWKVGDVAEIIPSHSCTTCNLYREFYVHEDGKVVDIWPIEASGKLA